MTKHFSHHAVAFGLAAIMTLGVLGSLSGMANTQYQAAQTLLAQTSAPAKAA